MEQGILRKREESRPEDNDSLELILFQSIVNIWTQGEIHEHTENIGPTEQFVVAVVMLIVCSYVLSDASNPGKKSE